MISHALFAITDKPDVPRYIIYGAILLVPDLRLGYCQLPVMCGRASKMVFASDLLPPGFESDLTGRSTGCCKEISSTPYT